MKSILLMLALAAPAAEPEATQADNCTAMAKTARQLMRARQAGVPAEKLMAPVEKLDEPLRSGLRQMVLAALASPRWETQERKEREIEEFSTLVYVSCMRAPSQDPPAP